MGFLRTYVLILIAGWALWFWLDKSEPAQPPAPPPFGNAPMAGYPRYPGPPPSPVAQQPPDSGDWIAEFQYTVNLVKAGRYQPGFVFLWRRQSWILAGILTILTSLLSPRIRQSVTQWRRRAQSRPGDDSGG